MKKITLRSVVRTFAIGGFSLYFFPLCLLVSLLWGMSIKGFDVVLPTCYKALAYCSFSCMVGAGLALFSDKIRQKLPEPEGKKEEIKALFLSNIILLPAAIALIVGMFFMLSGLVSLLLSLLAIYSMICGHKLHFKQTYDFFSGKRIGVAVGIFAAVEIVLLFLLKQQKELLSQYTGHLFWAFFAYVVIYCVTKNQSNIDKMMDRRHHDLQHLPNKMRYYSLRLTVIFVLAFLLIFIFRGFFADVFGWILSTVGKGLLYILLFIIRLISEEEGEPAGAMPEQDSTLGLKDAFEDDNSSPFWDYVFYPVLILGLATLIFIYRKDIAEAFARIWAKIVTLLRSIFLNNKVTAARRTGESEYYFDAVETLDPQSIITEKKAGNLPIKAWKKLYKKFKAMTFGNEKYRYGYALSMEWLKMRGVLLEESDTSMEILKKSEKVFPKEQYLQISDYYDHIRYGDETAKQNAVDALCALLDKLI